MILLVHNKGRVVQLGKTSEHTQIDYDCSKSLLNILLDTANFFPNELIIWVHQDYKSQINFDSIEAVFHHKLILASYAVGGRYFISNRIGYVEQKPYGNVSRNITYPTWLMSSDVGGMYAETLNQITISNRDEDNFDYALSSIAKQAMPKGLFCYSEPKLINTNNINEAHDDEGSVYHLFKFVKQHYKFTWLINLLLCFVIFECKLPLFSFVKSLFVKTFNCKIDLKKIDVSSNKNKDIIKEVDVIIPTLGRKNCLYDVLKDFSVQTLLPKKIIIVEQNPDELSRSELDYITKEDWPFQIEHYFIHKTGVCNARNLALSKVTSNWVLLGDDDNRFKSDLIEKFFNSISQYGCTVATSTYLKPKEKPNYFYTTQTDIFGSGNTMLKSNLLKSVKFDESFEFGYGEDSDFGMQLRKIGHDVIFFPDINITHLKAPIGGFRVKVKQLWDDEKVQPKPSPTMMLFFKKHFNKYQILGYKYTLFVKFYRKQNIKNPIRYIKQMNTQWDISEKWAQNIS